MPKRTTNIIRPVYPTAVIGDYTYQKPMNAFIHRITDCQHVFQQGTWEPGTVLGGYMSNSEPYWSNCDDKLLLTSYSTSDGGHYRNVVGIWSEYMAQVLELPRGTSQYYLRWDAKNPNYLYNFVADGIERFDMPTLKKHKYWMGFKLGLAGGEGDVSDTNEILLDKDGRTLCIYNLNRMATVDGSYNASFLDLGSLGAKGTAAGVDYATLSQDGEFILVSWSAGCRGHAGIEVYDRKWNFIKQLYPGVIHWVSAVDELGYSVIYTTLPFGQPEFMDRYKQQGYTDLAPGDFVKIRVDDGHITKLVDMPKWTHFMVAKRRGFRDRVYVSFEERVLPKSIKTLWTQPDWSFGFGELIEVRTDGSGFTRLCHTWCRPSRITKKPAKWWQPDNFAFGNRIGFRSCVTNDDVPEMCNGVGDLFYVQVG